MPFVSRTGFDTANAKGTQVAGFSVVGEYEWLLKVAEEVASLQLGPPLQVEILTIKGQTYLLVKGIKGGYPNVARDLVDQRITEGYKINIDEDWLYSLHLTYEKDKIDEFFEGMPEDLNAHPF